MDLSKDLALDSLGPQAVLKSLAKFSQEFNSKDVGRYACPQTPLTDSGREATLTANTGLDIFLQDQNRLNQSSPVVQTSIPIKFYPCQYLMFVCFCLFLFV